MIRAVRFLVASLCLLAAPAGALARQPADPYPVEALAGIMGELHFLSFHCEGRDAQDWRETMMELLELEAPARGAYRDRLIEAFNAGFRSQERRAPRCGAEAELETRRLANRGRSLGDQLINSYLP